MSAALLERDLWIERARAHAARADSLTAAHLARRAKGIAHPIEDFLFTYYSIKPSQLRRWTPGAGVALADFRPESDAELIHPRYFHAVHNGAALAVDVGAFLARREATARYIAELLKRTMSHPPQFGCFGLHEWAMVYRLGPEQLRHRGLPLRIGHEATDRVVESHRIACSHFDAFRFFTPEAAPLNTLQPTRETQPDLEQSGCLHAGMDIYKWIGKLSPIVPGEVLLDAFELARDIRVVDMQASPYDVSGYGYDPIPIETAAGKREYAQLQRGFADRGDLLRRRVLAAIDTVFGGAARGDRLS